VILKSAQIKNYKCIYDSGAVDLERDITCLIGKNESGKTAFMESLYRLNPYPSGHRSQFEELHDYPRSLRRTGMLNIAEFRPIEATFELDQEELSEIEELFGTGILKSPAISLSRNYGNKLSIDFDIEEKAFVWHVSTTTDLDIPIDDINTIDGLKNKLLGMQSRTPTANRVLRALTSMDLEGQVRQFIVSKLPKFVYFDEYSILPNRFSIPHLLDHQNNGATKEERTALALLNLAEMDLSSFPESEYEERKALLESAAVQITDEVFKFWSQNNTLRVDFDIDYKASDENDKQPPFLDIRIWNEAHRVSLKFSERSKGFVWFFSFMVFFAELLRREENIILLLDEPGLGLHATAQMDLLRFIEERLAPQHQLIYTTHSPFMINTDEIQRIRVAEDKGQAGTKIGRDFEAFSKESLLPVEAALGQGQQAPPPAAQPESEPQPIHEPVRKIRFLEAEDLIVENPSDVLYLQIMSAILHTEGRTGLDAKWSILPAGGTKKLNELANLIDENAHPAILLNVTEERKQQVNSMVTEGLLDPEKLFAVTRVTATREGEIEDLFDPVFYLRLLRESGEVDVMLEDLPPGERVIRRVELHTSRPLDRMKPANYLLRKQGELVGVISQGTLERFEKLFGNINQALYEKSRL
jgi:predicted ATPase